MQCVERFCDHLHRGLAWSPQKRSVEDEIKQSFQILKRGDRFKP